MILLLILGGLMATVGFVLVTVNTGRVDDREREAEKPEVVSLSFAESDGGDGASDLFHLEITRDNDPFSSSGLFEPEPLCSDPRETGAESSSQEPPELSLHRAIDLTKEDEQEFRLEGGTSPDVLSPSLCAEGSLPDIPLPPVAPPEGPTALDLWVGDQLPLPGNKSGQRNS